MSLAILLFQKIKQSVAKFIAIYKYLKTATLHCYSTYSG